MSDGPPNHGLPDRLGVNPSFVLVAEDSNTIHFRAGPWSGPKSTLRDADGDGQLESLVDFLTGSQTTDEFLATVDPADRREMVAMLQKLMDQHLVQPEEGAESPAVAGYLPIMRWGNEDTYERLSSKRVLVVTTGRVGEMVLEDLVAYDVGEVRALDVLGEGTTPSGVDEVPIDRLEEALADVDLMVYAGDRSYPDVLERLNRAALEQGTTWISGQVLGFDGIVGPLIFPGETACYDCFRERTMASVVGKSGYRAVEHSDRHSAVGTLPNFARIVAGLLVTEVVTVLSWGVGVTGGRILHYDFHDLSVEADDVLKLPRCEACGADPVTDATQSTVSVDRVVEDITRVSDE